MDACDLLSPNNVIDLAVLGVTSEGARTAAEVVAVVKRLAGSRFRPITDVVAGRIAALVEIGFLTPEPAGAAGEVLYHLSPAGRAQVQRLLRMQSGSPADALAAVCACLKICFLEMLDADARGAVIEDLLTAHRRALDDAETALAGCPCRCSFVQRWLAHDVERWRAELGWLEALHGVAAGRVSI